MLLADLSAARLLIVGDVMLDRYWFGEVARISPEAPVPVVRVNREEERLGGAANVALNVKTLGAQATLLTVVGDDEPARTLKKLLEREGEGHAEAARVRGRDQLLGVGPDPVLKPRTERILRVRENTALGRYPSAAFLDSAIPLC